ncbi:MAG: hypothetical protein IPI29_06550 [Ignavibacteria bacterium]|nr:hypothetical protein [Ignavibacteria bacterium]
MIEPSLMPIVVFGPDGDVMPIVPSVFVSVLIPSSVEVMVIVCPVALTVVAPDPGSIQYPAIRSMTEPHRWRLDRGDVAVVAVSALCAVRA